MHGSIVHLTIIVKRSHRRVHEMPYGSYTQIGIDMTQADK